MPQAWDLSIGSGVVVAILDDGVDLTHPDLKGNIFPKGYDARGSFPDGRCIGTSDNAHGSGCAGVISAIANNGIGTAGIAYGSQLMSIRFAFGNNPQITAAQFYNSIVYARTYADIMSISYSLDPVLDAQDNALLNASTGGGRKKNGMAIFASSGNDGNSGHVAYPSSFSSAVISVGASSQSDRRSSYSNYDGYALGLVAPGDYIPSTYNVDGKYYDSSNNFFSGTSAACPMAAAVGALVLSANPNLNSAQIRIILETTCDKISGYTFSNDANHPNGTYNNEVGYGRVNAYKAVQAALKLYYFISGPSQICDQQPSTYSINSKSGDIVTWSVNIPGAVNLSPSGNTVSVTRINSYYGEVVINAIITRGGSSAGSVSTSAIKIISVERVPLPPDHLFLGAVTLTTKCGPPGPNGNVYCYVPAYAINIQYSGNNQVWVNGGNDPNGAFVGVKTSSTFSVYLRSVSNCGTSSTAYLTLGGGGQAIVPNTPPCPKLSSSALKQLQIYPNPSQSVFIIDFNQFAQTIKQTDTVLSVATILPETVDLFSKESTRAVGIMTRAQIIQNGNKVQFNVSNLPRGFYFIHINYPNDVEERTVVVQ